MRPKPTSVRYNDWRQVKAPSPDRFEPSHSVSVVIPYYQTPKETEKTLAALEVQSYPKELVEVVVVDDGSEPAFRPPSTCPLQIKVVRQRRHGFGLSRARNLGARTAAHDILLFLDSDMLPEAGWIAAHARWHHVLTDALTVGIRKNVETDDIGTDAIRKRPGSLAALFSGRPATACWAASHLLRTSDLTSKDDEPFSAVVGANFGIRKTYYDAIGGTDESFDRWGSEDMELGYRAYAHGGLLAPARDATAWHQGLDLEQQAPKQRSDWINRGRCAHRVPHPSYRNATPGRFFAVPRHVVTLDARHLRADRIVRSVAKLLADRVHDLVVRVEAGPEDDDRIEYVRNELGADPRVRVNPPLAALDEFPVSAFHVKVPGGAVFAGSLVRRLEARLGDAVQLKSRLPDGSALTITRGWAIHRARRTGLSPAAFGDVRTPSASSLRVGVAAHARAGLRAPVAAHARAGEGAPPPKIVPYPSRRDMVLREVGQLRDLAGAVLFWRRAARWGSRQLGKRWRTVRGWLLRRRSGPRDDDAGHKH